MRRWLPAMLVIVALALSCGGLLWLLRPVQVIIWDGSFDLTVRVTSDEGPLLWVTCEAFSRQEYAVEAAEHHLPPQSRMWSVKADPFTGGPLTLAVPVSGRSTVDWRELKRFQFRHMVVIGGLPGGRRAVKLVEIPDCRVSREVAVVLP